MGIYATRERAEPTDEDEVRLFLPFLQVLDPPTVEEYALNSKIQFKNARVLGPARMRAVYKYIQSGHPRNYRDADTDVYWQGVVAAVPDFHTTDLCYDEQCAQCPLWFACHGNALTFGHLVPVEFNAFHFMKTCRINREGLDPLWLVDGETVNTITGRVKGDAPWAVHSRDREHFFPQAIKEKHGKLVGTG